MTAEKLMEAVRAGRVEEVPGLLEPLGEAERRACMPELKRLTAGLRDSSWHERHRLVALYLAGAGCQTGASAVAQWLMRLEFRWVADHDKRDVLDVLGPREPAWLGDVAHRMAAARESRVQDEAEVIAWLARRSGLAPPRTDGFVRGWVASYVPSRRMRLPEELRADPLLPALFPRIFEVEHAGTFADLLEEAWPQAIGRLVEEGLLERKTVVGLCVAKLLRGDSRQANLRFFRRLCTGLALTEDESAAHTADWARIAADGHSTVAGDAQAELRRLWEAGRLETGLLAEVSRSVLFRTEKKLLRAQLTLMGKALRADTGTGAPLLLPALAEAFGHPDTDVQERALKLAGRHLPALEDATPEDATPEDATPEDAALEDAAPMAEARRELADAAALLSPPLHERAARLFGGEPGTAADEPYEEVLPPVPEPRPLGPVPGSADEVAREVAVLLHGRSRETAETGEVLERALAGYARQAYRDLGALAEALRPLTERHPWLAYDAEALRRPLAGRHSWLDYDNALSSFFSAYGAFVLAALRPLRRREERELRAPGPEESEGYAYIHLTYAFRERMLELAGRLRTDPPPLLLATPTWTTGVLEPGELVERLREYVRLGARVGRADFEQALLRVRPDPAYAPEAAALGTPEGERLAAWLESGGLAQPGGEVVGIPMPDWHTQEYPGEWSIVRLEAAPRLQREFAGAFAGLGGRYDGPAVDRYADHSGTWPSVLPLHRETVAACLLGRVADAAMSGARDGAAHLPVLAEGEGEGAAGPALHLSLAYALGARHEEDRLAGVDALLVLAARGQLDAGRLGRAAGGLASTGVVKPGRLADALGTAAATGAYATVWSVLAAALPELLAAPEGGRRIGPLLALAADCVERCGGGAGNGGAEVPGGLAELAARGGSSQLVRQARRLRDALGRRGTPGDPGPGS